MLSVKRFLILVMMLSAILIASASAALAQTDDEGVVIYESSCARCHGSDGLGIPGTFPPLANNPDAGDHAYVVDVVTNGLEGKEIMGVSYDSAMPAFNNRLSPEEIELVSAYVVKLSGGGGGTAPPTTTLPLAATSGSSGEDLFTGTMPLTNGGTACIACHSAGVYNGLAGPTMAINLDGIVQSFGTAGFVAAITDPLVPGMIAVFGEHPITDQEANDLAAYLETTTADDSGGVPVDLLILIGLVGFAILMLITSGFIKGPQNAYVEKLRSSR